MTKLSLKNAKQSFKKWVPKLELGNQLRVPKPELGNQFLVRILRLVSEALVQENRVSNIREPMAIARPATS